MSEGASVLITRLTAAALGAEYRAGRLSPVEATEAALAQIERHHERINAYCLVDAEAALAQARASEQRFRQGAPLGPLDGVPMGLKDILVTKGWPTLRGSRLIPAQQDWPDDAPAVAALRDGGAVFLGKTTTPELAWKGVTDSPRTGVTRNPWDPDRSAGGSSGGAAAAVALGMGPVAPGTDGGGSVRIPASFCGIVALKPTYGLVPLWPVSPFGTLAHVGPMARTVEDTALLLDGMIRPDPRDWTQIQAPDAPFAERLAGGIEGWRVAFSPSPTGAGVDAEVAELVAAAARRFSDLGAQVEDVGLLFEDPVQTFRVLWNAGAAQATAAWTEPEQLEQMDPGLVAIREEGRQYSATDYVAASVRRGNFAVEVGRFFEAYDLLLTPTMPLPAIEAGREVPEGWPDPRWWSWSPFSYPFNLTQQPAASVPCGFTRAGLPVGLQIVAPKYEDARVLRAAAAYQDSRPFEPRWPEPA